MSVQRANEWMPAQHSFSFRGPTGVWAEPPVLAPLRASTYLYPFLRLMDKWAVVTAVDLEVAAVHTVVLA
jgi:hypothetical protein